MALMRCPECGKEVSDLAPACVHCGYPLVQASTRYTLVLLEPGDDLAATVRVLTKYLTLTDQEAHALIAGAPALLAQGLTLREAKNICAALSKVCTVKAVRDQNAATQEDALFAKPVDLEQPMDHPAGVPLTFRQTVGAILAALALWTAGTWLLAVLLDVF